MCFRHEIAGSSNLALLKKRIADFVALRLEERISHVPTNQELINHADQSLEHHDLVRDFSATDDGYKRSFGMFQGRSQVVDLFLHQEAGNTRQRVGDAFCRGMGAMGGAKGIVDIDFTQGGKLPGKLRIVLLLFLMEAEVL